MRSFLSKAFFIFALLGFVVPCFASGTDITEEGGGGGLLPLNILLAN